VKEEQSMDFSVGQMLEALVSVKEPH
jgi:hypothetical protein